MDGKKVFRTEKIFSSPSEFEVVEYDEEGKVIGRAKASGIPSDMIDFARRRRINELREELNSDDPSMTKEEIDELEEIFFPTLEEECC